MIKKRWNEKTPTFFESLNQNLKNLSPFQKTEIDQIIKQTCETLGIKTGEVMQLIRVIISGKGSGVDLLGMMELLGRDEICIRIEKGMNSISKNK